MSTFGGKIQEIPSISVDRFDRNNYDSEVYFLSHCHTDHMVGLSDYKFQDHLVNKDKYIYGTEITCAILKTQYRYIKNNVRVLDMDGPTIIQLKNGNISVLCIPAGHCPGSVMFLFEADTCVLYTGDYRINKSDIRKIKSFYNSFKQVKPIEKIYLDTTFFLKRFLKFPKREESLEEICKIIKKWTSRGKNYLIDLVTSAKYGYEYVFNEIYKETGMPVHVNRVIFEFYSAIPEMDNCVTLNGESTQIHCSCGTYYQYICKKPSSDEICSIKVSALRWTQNQLEDGFSCNSSNYYYVCYSTHASYEEGVELLRFLKPKSVEICVKHNNHDTDFEIAELINGVLDEWRPKEEEEFKHKLFEVEDNVSWKSCEVAEAETSSNFCDLSVLDSPPSRRRKIQSKVKTEISHKEEVKESSSGIVDCVEITQKVETSTRWIENVSESESVLKTDVLSEEME